MVVVIVSDSRRDGSWGNSCIVGCNMVVVGVVMVVLVVVVAVVLVM